MENLIILLFSFELIFFLALALFMSKNKLRGILKQPLAIFLVCFAFIYLFIPIFMVKYGLYRFQSSYDDSSYFIVNLLLMVLTYSIFNLVMGKSRNKIEFIKINYKTNIIISIFILLPAILASLFLFKYILGFNYTHFIAHRVFFLKGMGFLILLLNLFYVYLSLFVANFVLNKKKIFKLNVLFFIFVCLLAISSFTMIGTRFSSFILLILLLYIFFFVSKRIKKRHTIVLSIIFIFLLVAIPFLGYIRRNMYVLDGDHSILDIKEGGFLILESLSGNFGHYEINLWLFNNKWEIQRGKTFLAGFLNFIPRAIFPDKPYGGGPTLVNFIYPGSYSKYNENLTSPTPGLPAESFMNFGYWGFIIIGFLHGIILFLIKNNFLKSKMDSIDITLYVYLVISFSFLILFSEFLAAISRLVSVILPLLLVKCISKLSWHR